VPEQDINLAVKRKALYLEKPDEHSYHEELP
jgi:hypothetical protein